MRRNFCFSRSCSPYSDNRCLRSLFTPPGGTSSLHFDSRGLAPLFRNRSVPSRRDSLHFGPVYFAITNLYATLLVRLSGANLRKTQCRNLQTRRFFGGRQPLWGIGVTSSMLVILRPQPFNARTADSRPGPGPMTRTSTFFTPCSWAATPARSAATCAANGVDLREPRKPQPPEVAQDSVLPWRSVMVMMVLLKDACTCAIASSTFLRTFLRAGFPPCCAPAAPAFAFCF